jgi:transcriptional regulator with XRE-family HTH domain
MNFERLAMDWLRVIRGKRSQRAFSKRLGYRSNIAYRWESGVCFPTAAETFALAKCSGAAGRAALSRFYAARPAWLDEVDLGTRAGVARVLRDLRGKATLLELARRSGHSRFSVSRWLSGTAEPRLPELFALIDAATFRVLDFVSQFAVIERLPSVAEEWRVLQAARKAAYDVPWSHAVLRVLELTDYQQLDRHRTGWIAKRLGIAREEEERCLASLASARQIRKQGGRWVIDTTQTIDTGADPARARKLKAEWLKVGLSRLEAGASGSFAYNLMAVSRADLERLRELHAAYFRAMRALVAESAPSECVVLFNTELFALDAPHE